LDREQALNATICRPRRFSSLIPAETIQRLSEHHIFLGSSRYDYYWFLGGRAALNQLDSPRKLGKWPFVTAIAFLLVQLVLVMLSVGEPFRQLLDGGGELVLSAARLALAILIVVQAFKVRDILEDHMMSSFQFVLERQGPSRCPLIVSLEASALAIARLAAASMATR
jgi:hypothetical protein